MPAIFSALVRNIHSLDTAPLGRLTLRTAFAVCIVLLAVLSLLPSSTMVRTQLPALAEHFIAYAGTGAIGALQARKSRTALIVGLIAFAGALEWLQHWSPGRTPDWGSWLASSAGVLAGVCLVRASAQLFDRP